MEQAARNKIMPGDYLAEPNADRAEMATAEPLCAIDGAIDLRQNVLNLLKKGAARARQPHATRQPLEQLDAQFGLKVADLARQRWLRNAQDRGGAAKMLLATDRAKVTKMPKLHRQSILVGYRTLKNKELDVSVRGKHGLRNNDKGWRAMETASLEELHFGMLSSLDVRGTDTEIFTAGSGAPLLFLHGLDGLEGSAAVLRELARNFTVHAPSHPGFGNSARPDRLNRVDDLGYFYLDMMDQLGLDAPVVVGTSFGAWVAAETLTKEPGRASQLVLASPLGLPTADRREQHVADIFMLSRQELGRRMQLGDAGPGSDMAVLTKLPEHHIRRLMRNDEAASLYGWTPYMSNPKLSARLHRLSAPSLVVWGAEDAIVSAAYREAWRAALPQAEVETLAEAGHRIHADQPAKFASRIAAFAGR